MIKFRDDMKRLWRFVKAKYKGPMTLNEYQAKAWKTAIYPCKGHNLIYPVLGLNGEAGEIAEACKKMMRDDHNHLTIERKSDIIKEVGDVLWYVAALCQELNMPMEKVAQMNLRKLADRQKRGKIQGDGDHR
jgi:NTP pyrophosphatase (non-canonical NTP hydrolase)